MEKRAFKVMKKRWLKKKKNRLMKRVAENFSVERQARKCEGMRESIISSGGEYHVEKMREMGVFEDPKKIVKYHALT